MTNDQINQLVDHAAHYLPVQGPIGVFIHHNTLHAFQHLPFEEAVVQASELFGTEPYMTLAAYQRDFHRGRILEEDVTAVLAKEENAAVIPGRLDRRALRKALLIPGIRNVKGQRAEWLLKEGGWLKAFRTDVSEEARAAFAHDTPKALWETCLSRAPRTDAPQQKKYARPHAALFALKQVDLDAIVHPPLINLVSTFVDQGVAHWQLPLRNEGLLNSFRALHGASLVDPAGLGGLKKRLNAQVALDPEAIVLEALRELGVDANDTEHFITAELLALPGWAGMVRKLEKEPVLAEHQHVPCKLMDYLAVRLTLLVVALRNTEGNTTSWRTLTNAADRAPLRNELLLFDVVQSLGLSSQTLTALDQGTFDRLFGEITAFNELNRRRIWHLAYERRHERLNLLPLAKHHTLPPVAPVRDRYRADVFFCIDEREESVRRALEEIAPDVRTYGAAGFFGCAMHYSGNDDKHSVDLCPVVVKPAHFVSEQAHDDHEEVNDKRQSLRRSWAAFAYGHNTGSRNIIRGWIGSAITGFTALVPLVLRAVSPLTWFKLNEQLSGSLLPQARTELDFHRAEPDTKADNGLLAGFTTTEMADRVGGMLNTVGLTKNHARLVVFLGHGSTSLNNPHESAHDCGACGGRRGGANGRLFAAMANRPDVRTLLHERGVHIPEDTWFIGGYHDTCNDDADLLDLDRVPATHDEDLKQLRESLDEARAWSAHERAPRFEAAGTGIDHHEGLRHVRERASHLAEPRPEYGHCTNAVCIVGRRSTTRGLFFDRRAFLVSYDAHNDPQNKALAGVLGAVIPVCSGISLEYYFSFVDNEGYGCGTKQPHNVTGLIGVMNGYQSDLRTGLPWQMVEIHEPVRILFVVETTPERLMPIIDANPELTEFVKKRWIRISTMDPDTGAIKVYRDGTWEKVEGDEVPLPRCTSSAKYYSGSLEHLPVARIEPEMLAAQ
ncbi:MAG: DUF2309 domain-containing protein [Flavobacteriales bacterium]|nr:DUF2309 domain-containing protein [Flavobacteriales bacterium]